MTFVRKSTSERKSFDSSPDYTLPKAFGFVEGSVVLKEIERDTHVIKYDVHAKATADSRTQSVGILYQKTRLAIREELGSR